MSQEHTRPPLTIDLLAPEGNVFSLVEKARMTLEQAEQGDQAKALGDWFYALPWDDSDLTYDDVRRKVEQYCDVTWLNERKQE
jgi:hypothetical protein